MHKQNLDLDQLSSGTIVIIAPHMDDEVLACGGLIALLPNKDRIHIIYATDGVKSPARIIARRDEVSVDLGKIRMQESMDAMDLLGVPQQNLHFLCLSDGDLQKNRMALQSMLREQIKSIKPQFIFVPFRYDRHPDHLAVNHVIASDMEQDRIRACLVEYFVYHRWRLMSKRDIRKYIKPQFLFQLDIASVAKQKRLALNCFASQATIYYPWQTQPILTPTLLDEECQNPECFLIAPAALSGTTVFSGWVLWIRLAHRLEPVLKRWKTFSAYLIKSIIQNPVHESD